MLYLCYIIVHEMEVVKTSKGGDMLMYQGYSDVKKVSKNGYRRWSCSKGAMCTQVEEDKVYIKKCVDEIRISALFLEHS